MADTIGRTSGKALIRLERVCNDFFYGDVSVFSAVNRLGPCDPESLKYIAEEDLLISAVMHPPAPAKKMKEGDSMTFLVNYQHEYTRDYWGEHDVHTTYTKVRVIKRRKAKK